MPDKPERKPPRPRSKKRWEPPRVKTGQLFESNSLACGKGQGGDENCLTFATMS
jgi:hypothetical protein